MKARMLQRLCQVLSSLILIQSQVRSMLRMVMPSSSVRTKRNSTKLWHSWTSTTKLRHISNGWTAQSTLNRKNKRKLTSNKEKKKRRRTRKNSRRRPRPEPRRKKDRKSSAWSNKKKKWDTTKSTSLQQLASTWLPSVKPMAVASSPRTKHTSPPATSSARWPRSEAWSKISFCKSISRKSGMITTQAIIIWSSRATLSSSTTTSSLLDSQRWSQMTIEWMAWWLF